jgi:SAM-dependent methyltransferase
MTVAGPYDREFYERQRALSRRSARRVLPVVNALLAPRSVVDVGCGVGTWLRAFRDLGVDDLTGVEGAHIEGLPLEIERERLVLRDLSSGQVDLPWRFDLAMSLEVAEHLPPSAAPPFVRSLTALAPAVLFGAAVPGQGGDGHRNERWQDYWATMFAAHDFVALDVVRPAVWADPDVAWWYAQNTLLYVRRDELARRGWPEPDATASPLALVHPAMLLEAADRYGSATPRQLARAFVLASMRSFRRTRAAETREAARHTTLERFRPAGGPAAGPEPAGRYR